MHSLHGCRYSLSGIQDNASVLPRIEVDGLVPDQMGCPLTPVEIKNNQKNKRRRNQKSPYEPGHGGLPSFLEGRYPLILGRVVTDMPRCTSQLLKCKAPSAPLMVRLMSTAVMRSPLMNVRDILNLATPLRLSGAVLGIDAVARELHLTMRKNYADAGTRSRDDRKI